jgi:hypothetical protein
MNGMSHRTFVLTSLGLAMVIVLTMLMESALFRY